MPKCFANMSLHIFACPKSKVGGYVGAMFGASLLPLIYNNMFPFIYIYIFAKHKSNPMQNHIWHHTNA